MRARKDKPMVNPGNVRCEACDTSVPVAEAHLCPEDGCYLCPTCSREIAEDEKQERLRIIAKGLPS